MIILVWLGILALLAGIIALNIWSARQWRHMPPSQRRAQADEIHVEMQVW